MNTKTHVAHAQRDRRAARHVCVSLKANIYRRGAAAEVSLAGTAHDARKQKTNLHREHQKHLRSRSRGRSSSSSRSKIKSRSAEKKPKIHYDKRSVRLLLRCYAKREWRKTKQFSGRGSRAGKSEVDVVCSM